MKKFRLMGVIVDDRGERWSEDDVAPSQVEAFLRSVGPEEPIELEINSPGGSVTAGIAIANLLASAPNEITAVVYGMAASMAGVVACACDRLRAFGSSYLMLHNPWSIAAGEAKDFRKVADTLDGFRETLVGFYQRKIERDPTDIVAMMDATTWIAGADFGSIPIVADLVQRMDSELAIAACLGPVALEGMPEGAKRFISAVSRKPRLAALVAACEHAGQDDPPAEEPAAEEPPAEEPAAEEPPVEEPPAEETPAGEPAAEEPPAEEPPSDLPPVHGPSAEFEALVVRCEATERARRDIQGRADRLANDLESERSAHARTRSEFEGRVEALEVANRGFQERIARMALNALAAPSGGCAQSWDEALRECGGYEAAARAYPDLAEAYRKARAGR